MPPSVLAASHPQLRAGGLALAVAAVAAICVLVAIARPTHPCPRCDGERIRFTRTWLTGKARIRPCRRCSGTGRVPRVGARTIHRLIWSIRHERINRP
jgi:hypothetical protein